MKIAIVGTGISGLTAAWLLHPDHELTIYEANDWIGGHTHTVPVDIDDRHYEVDTGFIVFNDWTYPNFIRLLERLGVASQPSDMSWSVKCLRTGLEYNGGSRNKLFCQRINLLRPSFWRMIGDILRFNREAPELLESDDDSRTLGQYLRAHDYSRMFIDYYILPMGAAIWSSGPEKMLNFPVRFFVRFFKNHGMLSISERPQWRVVKGGSARYVEAMTRGFGDRIRLNARVGRITRTEHAVEVVAEGCEPESFDHVIIAAHSDEALAMLGDPTPTERDVLSAIPYTPNHVALHTDDSVLPRKRLAWASWNYLIPEQPQDRVALTYDMNILQTLDAPETFCVSLNMPDAIDPDRVIDRFVYAHPLYMREGVAAQRHHELISGTHRTHFCGAYWGYGFHEDGVKSALNVCSYFGKEL